LGSIMLTQRRRSGTSSSNSLRSTCANPRADESVGARRATSGPKRRPADDRAEGGRGAEAGAEARGSSISG
jgi:hypothetical protein